MSTVHLAQLLIVSIGILFLILLVRLGRRVGNKIKPGFTNVIISLLLVIISFILAILSFNPHFDYWYLSYLFFFSTFFLSIITLSLLKKYILANRKPPF